MPNPFCYKIFKKKSLKITKRPIFFSPVRFPAYEKNDDEATANKKPDHCPARQLLCHLANQNPLVSANENPDPCPARQLLCYL
jgi:hypothetical protein